MKTTWAKEGTGNTIQELEAALEVAYTSANGVLTMPSEKICEASSHAGIPNTSAMPRCSRLKRESNLLDGVRGLSTFPLVGPLEFRLHCGLDCRTSL